MQHGQGHVHANHGRRLQQPFVVRRQAVDTGCEDGLYGSRHRQRRRGLHEPIGAQRADQGVCLDEGPQALFQKEWVALGVRDE